MAAERGPGFLAETRDDVEHAGRKARLQRQLTDSQRRQRCLFGGLEHDAVAGGQGGRRRAPGHLNWIVPRNDVARHAVRLATCVHVGARGGTDRRPLDPLHHARVEREVASSHSDIVARLAQRLAGIEALERGELLRLFGDQAGEGAHDGTALRRRRRTPFTLKRAPRGVDRGVDLGLPAARDRRTHLAGRRIEHIDRAVQRHQLAIDDRARGAEFECGRHLFFPIRMSAGRRAAGRISIVLTGRGGATPRRRRRLSTSAARRVCAVRCS